MYQFQSKLPVHVDLMTIPLRSLIDWCLTPTLAVFQLYIGIKKFDGVGSDVKSYMYLGLWFIIGLKTLQIDQHFFQLTLQTFIIIVLSWYSGVLN